MRLSHLTVSGELVSSDASQLPSDVAVQIAEKIHDYLGKNGCSTNPVAGGQGPAGNALSFCEYSLAGCTGRVDVFVIENAYESRGENVLAQVIVTVNEAR